MYIYIYICDIYIYICVYICIYVHMYIVCILNNSYIHLSATSGSVQVIVPGLPSPKVHAGTHSMGASDGDGDGDDGNDLSAQLETATQMSDLSSPPGNKYVYLFIFLYLVLEYIYIYIHIHQSAPILRRWRQTKIANYTKLLNLDYIYVRS